jgi:5'-3' exonuclease
MRLHLVDGTFELFRAHFSKAPGQVAPWGQDVKATVGVAASLLALCADPAEAPTHLAVAFDNPIRSFRNDLFPAYKSDDGVPEVLRAQFDLVEDAVRALGMVVWSMDRFEADDALATGAARWWREVEQVRILTPDKDLGQSLRGERVVQVDRIRGRVLSADAYRELRGVASESVPDFLALVGDDADGIPGIPGWGARSASKVLGRYPHLEMIPRDPRAWEVTARGTDRLAEALFGRWDEVLLYRTLATLAVDVPLPETLDDLAWRGAPRGAFLPWAKKLGAARLVDRVPRFAEGG